MSKSRLTQSAVDRAPVKDRPYRITDVGGSNLSLRVYTTGVKTYFYRYKTPEGKAKDHRVGDASILTLKEARQKSLTLNGEVEHGTGIGMSKRERAKCHTFGELAALYLNSAQFEGLAQKSKTNYSHMLNQHILPVFANEVMTEIERGEIVRFLESLIRDGRGAGVSRSCKAIVSTVFTWSQDHGFIKHHVGRGIKNVVPQGVRKRVLSEAEIHHLWRIMTYGRHTKDISLLTKFVILTAQRIGETTKTEIDEIDFQRREWLIPEHRAKNKRTHVVPLSQAACNIIRQAMGDRTSGKVFNLGDRALTSALRHYDNDPNFNGRFTAHDLRRTFVTNIYRVAPGTSIDLVKLVINHKSRGYDAMSHYNHYEYLEEKRELLQKWSDYIIAI